MVFFDPTSLSEDISNDAMKAGAYGIKNLKYILGNFNTWLNDKDPDFTYRDHLYDALVSQYVRYLNNPGQMWVVSLSMNIMSVIRIIHQK